MRVSVIMPAFNARAFIERSVQSALAQTSPPHEVIVVDDGSTDDTLEILRAFGPAVTVLRQTNGGAGKARNAGARAATGDWLAFLDSDDEWRPEKLEEQARLASDDVALVYSDRFNVGDRGEIPARASDHLDLVAGEAWSGLLEDNVITTSSVLMRRTAFESLGGFSEDANVVPAEDWDLWLRVASGHRIRYCPKPLIDYRFHKTSISRKDLRMNRARVLVLERALASPAAVRLSWLDRRRVWSVILLHNSYDAYRAGSPGMSVACCVRAAAMYPFQWPPWRDLAKIALRRL